MIRIVFMSVLLVVSLVGLGFAPELTGRWEGKVKGPDGEDLSLVYVFKVDGDKLTGTVESQMGQVPLTEGKVNDDAFSFNIQVGDSIITNEGKFKEDTATLKAHGPWGDAEFTIKRAAAK
jgi:hypothetical protein